MNALRTSLTHLQMTNQSSPNLKNVHIAANLAVGWLLHNQSRSIDGGFATYDFADGWTSSYPETTGYIVETLLMWKDLRTENHILKSARRALDWLVSIQKPSGGWAGGYVHEMKPEIVFNTGQIIRGLLQGHLHFHDPVYLDSARKAADWLVKIQSPEGFWGRHVHLDTVRVYDTYVASPLYQLGSLVQNPMYKNAALRNAYWVAMNKIKANGWLIDADNTLKYNDKPILHTIAYTMDGLIDIAFFSNDIFLQKAGLATASAIGKKLQDESILRGRYSSDWRGHGSICNTGVAQIAIIFAKLHIYTGEEYWRSLHNVLINYLLCQQIRTTNDPDLLGALTGSSPIWGRYEPFRLPNWGVKYLVDALMYCKTVTNTRT